MPFRIDRAGDLGPVQVGIGQQGSGFHGAPGDQHLVRQITPFPQGAADILIGRVALNSVIADGVFGEGAAQRQRQGAHGPTQGDRLRVMRVDLDGDGFCHLGLVVLALQFLPDRQHRNGMGDDFADVALAPARNRPEW